MTQGNPDGVAAPLFRADDKGLPSPLPREHVLEQLPEGGGFQGVVLDINDPVEAALTDMIQLYRYRRPTLMIDGDVFATYTYSARNLDIPSFGTPEALLHRVQTEQANINAMRRGGTLFDQQNDAAMAAYLEMAFHASLLYAWIKIYMRR